MKPKLFKMLVLASLTGLIGCTNSSDPSKWDSEKTNQWFEAGAWHEGVSIQPDATIDRQAMAVAYHKNPERWDAAFAFMKNNDLAAVEVKRHDIDGDNLFALVSEYSTRNEEDVQYEAHRKYADIQYVISGSEQIGIGPISTKTEVSQEYTDEKDIEFFSVSEVTNYPAKPDRFFVFFPGDAHRPGLKTDSIAPVKKLVIKIKLD
jgi:YhcH/YjgK/YiaL family protein